ncbi:hypothetical protein AB205_0193710 [Aquarana catesbeiana]|uniref:Uncharacterized protein n=1 Tax=Aquarana catesbeiana TaxID=8400 RepID=A0A2G9S8F9_AQUCT|nr:hypothetical protein AB205_0193710 [Aquarana catesbeiana]
MIKNFSWKGTVEMLSSAAVPPTVRNASVIFHTALQSTLVWNISAAGNQMVRLL